MSLNYKITKKVSKFLYLEEELDKAEKEMYDCFKELYVNTLETKSKEELLQIKEKLRQMPQCPSKVFLFREIIIAEEKLNKP